MKFTFIISFLFVLGTSYASEVCDNGIDDDNDGLIDLKDPDCTCIISNDTSTLASLIPNPSFNDTTCCTTNPLDFDCAVGWRQASDGSSDYYHPCRGYDTTYSGTLPYPLPSGDSTFVGYATLGSAYREYVASCLSSTMNPGTLYEIELDYYWDIGDSIVSFIIYGSNSCTSFPWVGSGCPPTNNWTVLDSIQVVFNGHQWKTVNLSFIPNQPINAVAIGSPCSSSSTILSYYLVDNLRLKPKTISPVTINISKIGSFCQNNVTLIATPDTTGGTWQWYKDSIALVGETDSILNISSTNLTSGVYTVRYSIDSTCYNKNYVLDTPFVSFQTTVTSPTCLNDTAIIKLININTTSPYQIYINGNGPYTDSIYKVVGDTFEIIIKDTNLCTDTNLILIANPIGVKALFKLDSVCFGDSVTFTNNSTGNNLTYSWDYGDGTSDNNSTGTFKHYYSNSGLYAVQLVALDTNGCNDTFNLQTIIYEKPKASFAANSVCLGEKVQFINHTTLSGSTNTNGVKWFWNFGNTLTDTSKNPGINYTLPGVYSINLRATAIGDCFDDTTQTIEIFSTPSAEFNADSVCFGDSTTIINTSTGANLVYSWNFGDSTSGNSSLIPLTHLYPAVKSYTIQLIVIDSNNCRDTANQITIVFPNPIVDFSFTNSCLSTDINLTNQTILAGTTNTNGVTWNWNFGNGTSSIIKNPLLSYDSSAIYTVTLNAISPNGCVGDTTHTITIYPSPIANFGFDTVCLGNPTSFIDLSTITSGQITNWDWLIETSYTVQNPSHIFSLNGNPVSQLIVTSDKGCKDTTKQNIPLNPKPIADFFFTPSQPTILNNAVCFTNTSSSTFMSNWDFGFGATSSNINPCITFPDTAGSYTITLKAINPEFCEDTISKTIHIAEDYLVYIPNSFTPNNDGINDVFKPHYFSGVKSTSLLIFDRWGKQIYLTELLEKGWDGTYKNELCKSDVYIYKILITDINNRIHDYIGHVNLLK